jgi:hypothetical protein
MNATSSSPGRTWTRPLLRYGLSAVITGLFLYLAFRGTDFSKLLASMREANYWWMIPNFACLMLSHYIRAWRWRYMLEPVKERISLRNLFSGVMVGYMMNNILPRAGELARAYALAKAEGIPKSAAFGTIVVERIIDTVSFLLLVVLMPLVYQGPLKESFPWLGEAGVIISAATVAVLGFLIMLMLRRDWTDRALNIFRKVLPARIDVRLDGWVHAFLDGFLFLKKPSRFLIIFMLSVSIWGLYIVMTYVAFFAFGLQAQVGLSGALVVLAISSIGVALPTPGGTGTYHAFASQSLTRLFAVDATTALSYATVTHAVGFIGVTVIGLYYFLHDHIRMSEAVGDRDKAAS